MAKVDYPRLWGDFGKNILDPKSMEIIGPLVVAGEKGRIVFDVQIVSEGYRGGNFRYVTPRIAEFLQSDGSLDPERFWGAICPAGLDPASEEIIDRIIDDGESGGVGFIVEISARVCSAGSFAASIPSIAEYFFSDEEVDGD